MTIKFIQPDWRLNRGKQPCWAVITRERKRDFTVYTNVDLTSQALIQIQKVLHERYEKVSNLSMVKYYVVQLSKNSNSLKDYSLGIATGLESTSLLMTLPLEF